MLRTRRTSSSWDSISSLLGEGDQMKRRYQYGPVTRRAPFVPPPRPVATCRKCGCTNSRACPGGCFWVEVDGERGTGLCSSCA